MTNASSKTTKSPVEPQNDAENTMMSQSEALDAAHKNLVQLAENEKERSFAYDINYKMDHLEEQLQSLGQQYKLSERKFRQAIGDISSRTALVTNELSQFGEQMLKGDTENTSLISAIDQRLKNAIASLQNELSGLDGEVTSQYTTIQSLQSDLKDSYSKLDQRVSLFERDINDKISRINEEQSKQGKTQHIFSDLLDNLKQRSNRTADDLYATQVDIAEQRRIGKKALIISTSVLASTVITLAGVMAYLHLSDTSLTQEQVSTKIDSALSGLNQNLEKQFVSQADASSEAIRVQNQISNLENTLSRNQVAINESTQSVNETLEELSEKISALQLSVYGPEDDPATLAQPSISLLDNDWILQQNPENYSIQLVRVYRERSMLNFINQHAEMLADHPVAFNISKYRGQDWFNVIYGNFASFQEAQKSLDSLPEALQKNAPWVRQMGSIQRTGML